MNKESKAKLREWWIHTSANGEGHAYKDPCASFSEKEVHVIEYTAYQSAIERVKELRETVTVLQVELNSLRTVNEILQSERLAKTKESP